MVWSENAQYYAIGAVILGVAGYLLFRRDYVGPAILAWGTAACCAIVASPRGA